MEKSDINPKFIVTDWRLDGDSFAMVAAITFRALPMSEPGELQKQIVQLPQIGLAMREIERLHTDLGGLIEQLKSRGSETGRS